MAYGDPKEEIVKKVAGKKHIVAIYEVRGERIEVFCDVDHAWMPFSAEYEGKTAPIPHVVRMNLVVTAVPFSDEDILAHMDTSSGELILDTGHIENQDLKVVVDYDTAKAILIEGNPQAGMQAFMAGKVRVEGDMAKLMALTATPGATDPAAAEMAARLRDITE